MDSLNPEIKNDESLNEWKDDIRTSCMNIFCNFAKFNDDDKEFYISQQNILKILRTVNLLESVPNTKSLLKLCEVDCLLKKINSKGQKINGKQFMNLIVLITAKLDPENFVLNQKMSVVKIIKTFFEPFSNFIEEKCTATPQEDMSTNSINSNFTNIFFHKQIENRLLSITLDNDTLIILDSVYNGIKTLFKSYFHYEVNKYNDPDIVFRKDLSGLIEFCKNFEICPFILTTNKIAIYFNLILEMDIGELMSNNEKFIFSASREVGNFFTISKFTLFLVHMAILSFDKHSSNKEKEILMEAIKTPKTQDTSVTIPRLSQAEKLVIFFENLENSKGVQFLEKRTNQPSNCKMNLIPTRDIIDRVAPQLVNLAAAFSINKPQKVLSNCPSLRNNFSSAKFNFSSINEKNDLDYRNFLTVTTEEAIERFSSNYDVLKEIFDTYSQIGDKFRNNHMTLSGFTRFLKDCNLIHVSTKANSDKNNLVKLPPKYKSHYSKNSSSVINRSILKKNINGKVLESDISVVFLDLTGHKNFDSREKIKNHFDRNKGFTPNFNECISIPNINKIEHGRKLSSKVVIPMKLNFNLFLRSFESLAMKIYPEVPLDEAIIQFFDNNLNAIIKEHSDHNLITVKKNLLEALSYLKREEIVYF
jgi:hypothetical protein